MFWPESVLASFVLFPLCACLVACGGGGDGGSAPPVAPSTIDLTAANRDAVAHAAAANFLTVGVTNSVPLSTGSASVALRVLMPRILAAWSGTSRATILSQRQNAMPQQMVGTNTQPCAISGSITVTVDDRDLNGMVSAGDVLTFSFSNCQDTTSEVLNGTSAVTFTAVGLTTLPTFAARVTYTQMSDEAIDHRHGMVLDGSQMVDYRQTSSTAETVKLTADGALVSVIHTHAFGSDTVTQLSGFAEESSYEAAAAGPSSTIGLTLTTLAGTLQSEVAGGTVTISMPGAPIANYDGEVYPHAGTLQVRGHRGTIQLTALSADQVQIDLDDNDDTFIESTKSDTWDWLL